MVDKVREEIDEVMEEAQQESVAQDKVEMELGDLLFATVNFARHLKVNPEVALAKANLKFVKRFQAVEQKVTQNSKQIDQCSLEELDGWWDEVKQDERSWVDA